MPRIGIGSFRRRSDDADQETIVSRQKQPVYDVSFDHSPCSVDVKPKCECERKRLAFGEAKMETAVTPEELTEELSREQPLRTRRNAICNEIERRWFIHGAYLEKHRHNLQVTHELTARGLMWAWYHQYSKNLLAIAYIEFKWTLYRCCLAGRNVNVYDCSIWVLSWMTDNVFENAAKA